MAIATEWVHAAGPPGYLAWPERAARPLPAILVLPEVWGVDAHLQDVTRRIAAAGYAALAPDLLARDGARPAGLEPARVAEVQDFMNGLPPAVAGDSAAREAALAALPAGAAARLGETHRALFAGIAELGRFLPPVRDAVTYLRTACPVAAGGKVAVVGFCMGGGLAALLAAEEPALAGAAIFYGRSPPEALVPRIACPVVGFYGALDARVNAGVPAFAAAMRAAGKRFEHAIYEGAPHAFLNDDRPAYEVRAARDAFARLLAFLRETAGA